MSCLILKILNLTTIFFSTWHSSQILKRETASSLWSWEWYKPVLWRLRVETADVNASYITYIPSYHQYKIDNDCKSYEFNGPKKRSIQPQHPAAQNACLVHGLKSPARGQESATHTLRQPLTKRSLFSQRWTKVQVDQILFFGMEKCLFFFIFVVGTVKWLNKNMRVEACQSVCFWSVNGSDLVKRRQFLMILHFLLFGSWRRGTTFSKTAIFPRKLYIKRLLPSLNCRAASWALRRWNKKALQSLGFQKATYKWHPFCHLCFCHQGSVFKLQLEQKQNDKNGMSLIWNDMIYIWFMISRIKKTNTLQPSGFQTLDHFETLPSQFRPPGHCVMNPTGGLACPTSKKAF